MGSRFQTENDSNHLRDLNKGADGGSYFLISSEDSSEGEPARDIQAVLCRLSQIHSAQEFNPQSALGAHAAQIMAWVDGTDSLSASYLIQIMAMAAVPSQRFDLQLSIAKGGYLKEKSSSCSMQDFLEKDLQCLVFCTRRQIMMRNFVHKVEQLYAGPLSIKLISDGVSIGLLVEGQATDTDTELTAKLCRALVQAEFPLVIANSSKNKQLQCLLMTPVRLPLLHKDTNLFKGLILCRNLGPEELSRSQKIAS